MTRSALHTSSILKSVACSLTLALAFPAAAQEPADDPVDENDVNTRFNPVIDNDDDDIDIPVPAFINRDRNLIQLNGADWSALRSAIAGSNITPISIINIGDSHIQADIGTGTVRDLLQFDYGNAGRGLVAPLKMSGTNQPVDYYFSSPDSWTPAKIMSSSWNQVMGFNGTSIKYTGTQGTLTVGTSERDDYDPFFSMTIFHNGKMDVTSVTDSEGNPVHFRAIPSRDYTQLIFASGITGATIRFRDAGDLTVFGASLSGERPGIFYHAIGNNGATFDTYNRIGTVGAGIAPLKPRLIILSLGTNEAFGHFNATSFTRSLQRLVNNIRASNPDAQILLTTPMECDRSVYTSVPTRVKVPVKKRTGRGRKKKTVTTYTYKTVNKRVRSYAVNSNVRLVRDAILKWGADNHVAVYDLYDVASGDGAAARWIQNGLFSADRVHHSVKGYRLEGRLLYEALVNAFNNKTL